MKKLFYQTKMNAAAAREGKAVQLLSLSARASCIDSFRFRRPRCGTSRCLSDEGCLAS